MKKVLSLVMATLLMGALVSCSQSKKDANGVVYNEEFNEEKMDNVKGEEVTVQDNDDIILCKTSGFAFQRPESLASLGYQDGNDEESLDPEAFYDIYIPREPMEKYNSIDEDTMSDEEIDEITQAVYASEIYIFAIYRVNQDEEETVTDAEEYKSDFANNEEIGTVGNNTFYFAYNDEVSTDGLSDEAKEDVQTIINSLQEVKDSIILFAPTDPMDDFKASMESFTTTDLDGNEVTQDIFKDYDVTMVNVWATWCKYCVAEMPEIQELYDELPDNSNIITICSDGATETETAKELLDQTGAKFTTINSNDELETSVIDYVTGYPTTFFVDSTGKVIGQLQIGTPADEGEIASAYLDLLNDALESAK